MLPYLRYKEMESELQSAFGSVPVVIETISETDLYYTDGDVAKSSFKIVIDSLTTVYVPQFIYNVKPEHKKIIQKWITSVEGLNGAK